MGSDLERRAYAPVIEQLHAAGVTLPADLEHGVQTMLCGQGSTGARLWAAANPVLAEDWRRR